MLQIQYAPKMGLLHAPKPAPHPAACGFPGVGGPFTAQSPSVAAVSLAVGSDGAGVGWVSMVSAA